MQAIALYELSRDLASASELDEILRIVVRHVGGTFGREAAILLAAGETLQLRAASPGLVLSEKEMAVAALALGAGQPTGRGTATMAGAAMRFMPLKTVRGVVGVLGVKPVDPGDSLSQEQRRLLEVFASQSALAIERAELAEQARQAQVACGGGTAGRAAELRFPRSAHATGFDHRHPLQPGGRRRVRR